jgi:hypothetical protein
MGILEYHEGCNVYPAGCMGPWNNFYTLFGTELRFLTGHIFSSIIIGVILFSALFFLIKKGKINLNIYLAALISIITSVLLFFIFAYFLRVVVMY